MAKRTSVEREVPTSAGNGNGGTTVAPAEQEAPAKAKAARADGDAGAATLKNPVANVEKPGKGKPKAKGKRGKKKTTYKEPTKEKGERKYIQRPYPQRTLEEALKVPQAIKEKNNGNPLATQKVAEACGYTNVRSTGFIYLAYSSRDYGLTTGTFTTEKIELQELGRKIVYAPDPATERQKEIEAFFKVDIFKKVFDHYGGSELPEKTYLSNVLEGDFGLMPELHDEFVELFKANCKYLQIEKGLRETESAAVQAKLKETTEDANIKVIGQPKGKFDRTAFVIMPFGENPYVIDARIEKRSTGYFMEVLNSLITPAANDAGFAVETAEQHGSEFIQSTIMDRLLTADLVICDMTDHNPNVFFELGIRMAKELPVQLIRADGTKRIFDVDNVMRAYTYSPNLWATTIANDRSTLTDHIKATWDNRSIRRSYMQILTGKTSKELVPK